MTRALIVGDGGQDGRILWDQLAARNFSLIGISRNESRSYKIRWDKSIDIADPTAVANLMEHFAPDQIYYLAAHHHSSQQDRGSEVDTWSQSLSVHVHAFSIFLHYAKLFCPNSRIFYAASSRIFGEAAVSPQNENTPIKPCCVYGLTKASGMLLADYYRRVYGTRVSCGILYNHESPLRGQQFVSRRVIDGLVAVKYGRAASLEIGSLDARVDWGYAPDYTRAMQLILEADKAEDFIIASGRTYSVREMIIIAAKYLDLSWERYVFESPDILNRNPQELCGDPSRLREVTHWEASVDFLTMVKILVNAAEARHHGGPITFP